MKVLVTGAAGFIGFHTCKALLDRGDEVIGFDAFTPYYDPQLKERRHAQLEESQGLPRHPRRPARREGARRRLRRAGLGAGHPRLPSRRAGGRAPLDPPSRRVHAGQHRRHQSHPRAVQGARGRGPGLRVVELGLRRQRRPDALRGVEHRSSGLALRHDQEGQRAAGLGLPPSVRRALDRPALLHGLRALGPSGHGALPLHRRRAARSSDEDLRPRQDAPRLHLRRRHRAGHRRLARQATTATRCSTSAPGAART